MLKNKMCPYYSHSVDAVVPTICCFSRHNCKQVKFAHEQGMDKYHKDFCSSQYKGCVEYKILKAEEICSVGKR